MATTVRYRSGIDGVTGQVLRGKAHLAQSLATLWMTRTGLRFMALDYGSNLRSLLAEDVEPGLALELYDEMMTSVRKHEKEYRVANLQFVSLTRSGGLGLRHDGLYYPEGRFENYEIVEPFGEVMPLAAQELIGRRGLAA